MKIENEKSKENKKWKIKLTKWNKFKKIWQ